MHTVQADGYSTLPCAYDQHENAKYRVVRQQRKTLGSLLKKVIPKRMDQEIPCWIGGARVHEWPVV